MNPQRQLPTQPQMSAEQIQKHKEYLKQQQKLRLMASSTQKSHQVSADSLIENLLGKKDTFTPINAVPAYSSGNNDSQPSTIKASPQAPQGQASNQPATVEWLSPNSPNFPAMYHRVWSLVGQPDGMADTGKLFPLLLTSGLHTDVLGFIWGLVNRCVAGKLTELELYALLALVALAQRGYSFNSADVLSLVPHPPIPNLNIAFEPQLPNKMTREELNLQPQTTGVTAKTIPVTPLSLVASVQQPVTSLATTQTSIFEQFHSQPINQNMSNDFDDFDDFQSAATGVSVSLFANDLMPTLTSNIPGSPQQKNLSSLESIPTETSKELITEASSSLSAILTTTDMSDIPEPVFVQKFPTISVVGGGRSIGSRLANHSLGASKTNKSRHHKHPRNEQITSSLATVEDDFSDFQQASSDNMFSKCSIKPPPTHTYLLKESAIRMDAPASTELSSSKLEDKEHKTVVVEEVNEVIETPVKQAADIKAGSEMMGVEDRYGALRALSLFNDNPTESSDDFGDFFSTVATAANDSFADIATRSSASIVDNDASWGTSAAQMPGIVEFEVDDWGSFATATDTVCNVKTLPLQTADNNQAIVARDDWGVEPSLMNNLSSQLTELSLEFNVAPIQSDSKIIASGEFDSTTILAPKFDFMDSIGISVDMPVLNVSSGTQNDEDDFGDFVSTDSSWPKDGNILLENISWTEDGKEVDTQSVGNLWLEETKITEDQPWPEEVKYDQSKVSKDGILDNHLVSNLWLEESKTTDNQSVRSLELPGLDQSWNAVGEWRKCLQTCLTILQFAVDTFETVSDPKVMLEILSSVEGQEYLKGLVEVWAICERLAMSCRHSGVEHKLDALLNSTESAWNLLRPHYTDAHVQTASEMELEGQDPCNICLGTGAMLEFEGCTYHTPCANLWLNYIDTVLPAIHQP